MQSYFFISLAEVKGTAKHHLHVDQIEVLKWGWSVHNTSTSLSSAKASYTNFYFEHYFDQASPALAKHCDVGKRFDEVVVSACRLGAADQDFLTMTLRDVLISSVSVDADSRRGVFERVELCFGSVDSSYTETEPADLVPDDDEQTVTHWEFTGVK